MTRPRRSIEGVELERDGLVGGQRPALLPGLGEGSFVELRADRRKRLFVLKPAFRRTADTPVHRFYRHGDLPSFSVFRGCPRWDPRRARRAVRPSRRRRQQAGDGLDPEKRRSDGRSSPKRGKAPRIPHERDSRRPGLGRCSEQFVEVVARRSGHAGTWRFQRRDHSRCPIRTAFERQTRFTFASELFKCVRASRRARYDEGR